MGGIAMASDRVRLRALLALDNIELNFIALFERFVAVQLDRRVVNKYIRSVFTPDESIALGVIEPLHFALVLSHRVLPFLHHIEVCDGRHSRERRPLLAMTTEMRERLIQTKKEKREK